MRKETERSPNPRGVVVETDAVITQTAHFLGMVKKDFVAAQRARRRGLPFDATWARGRGWVPWKALSARPERRQRGSGRPLVSLLPGRPDGTSEGLHRCWHLDRPWLDDMNA